jgi:3-hydroxymyristoyl/3-hydroxydecanoyl-(acyl carrier protein) dehydratase
VIVVPEICATERNARGIRLRLSLPPDLTYFAGHFPEHALLPGVVQIGWAIELGRQHIPFTGTFRALTAVKFTRVIQPDEAIELLLEYHSDQGQLDFEYRLNERSCSSGSILFDA